MDSSPFPLWKSLVCGGAAGVTVDMALYPLDTIKTRLQSAEGFLRSGGFRGVYRGVGVAALGSAPGAAFFFASYDSCKQILSSKFSTTLPAPVIHMFAAAVGETMACFIRVPTEVIKQRQQTTAAAITRPTASPYASLLSSVKHIYRSEGIRGFYRGFAHTLLREIPFSLIQFPLYEYLKVSLARITDRNITPLEMSLCGSLAGGVSAAITTPLDVIKTREMLRVHETNTAAVSGGGRPTSAVSYAASLVSLYREEGIRGMFRGVGPRVMWISIGGVFFFGAYEEVKNLLMLCNTTKRE